MPDRRKRLPSQKRLLALFRYDSVTGSLFWKFRPDMDARWNGRFAGARAGRRADGTYQYASVAIDYESYLVHRIIFKIVHGKEPRLVDHRDQNKRNNRDHNLRAGSKAKNGANSKRPDRCLPRGVYRSKNSAVNPYRAHLCKEYLGQFPTIKAASAAFKKAHQAKYGEFSCQTL